MNILVNNFEIDYFSGLESISLTMKLKADDPKKCFSVARKIDFKSICLFGNTERI
jgi:hypothetical protein